MAFEAVVSEDTPERYTIKVDGDLASPECDGFAEMVAGLVADRGTVDVVVDVSGVGFLDSSGVRTLLQARQATIARGGSLTVTGARGTVAEVLRITAVDSLLCATATGGD